MQGPANVMITSALLNDNTIKESSGFRSLSQGNPQVLFQDRLITSATPDQFEDRLEVGFMLRMLGRKATSSQFLMKKGLILVIHNAVCIIKCWLILLAGKT